MNFLEKLDLLMSMKKLNKKKLSELSGIPYTTIANWYKRSYENMSVSTFKTLCVFFNVSMDYLARDEITEIEYYDPVTPPLRISQMESLIVAEYRKADQRDKELALRALKIDEKKDSTGISKIS